MKNRLLLILLLPFALHASWQTVEEYSKHAVIQILNHSNKPSPFEPYRRNLEEQNMIGSGFFINEDGEFLTNYHVIEHAKRLEILMPSVSRDRFEAELVGCKPARDIALCRLTKKGKAEFQKFLEKVPGCNGVIQYLELADDDRLSPAQEIMALGYPLGDGFKRTIGHINGLSLNNGVWCQISAPINGGSSGGPSLNPSGKVIGINSAGSPKASVVGYMIPVTALRNAIADMRAHKVISYELGFHDQRTTQNLLDAAHCPAQGTRVTHVLPESFADTSGLKVDDIIMSINGHAIDRDGMVSVDWIDARVPSKSVLDSMSIGDTLEIEVWRKDKAVTLTTTLPASTHVSIERSYPEAGPIAYRAFGGLVIQPLRLEHSKLSYDAATRSFEGDLFAFLENFNNRMEHRLVVSKVFDCSQAEREPALHAGALIESVNGQTVRTLEDLDAALRATNDSFITIGLIDQHTACLHLPTLLSEDRDLQELHQYEKVTLLEQIASPRAVASFIV